MKPFHKSDICKASEHWMLTHPGKVMLGSEWPQCFEVLHTAWLQQTSSILWQFVQRGKDGEICYSP